MLAGTPDRDRRRTLDPIDGGLALTVIVIWAFNFIVGKIGLQQLPPLLLLSLRFSLVALLLVGFLKRPPQRFGGIVLLSFVLGGLHFGCMFAGLDGVGAGPAAIAIQLTVPFSSLLAYVWFGERLGRWQIVGMAVAFAGVYVLAGGPDDASSLSHFLLVVAGAWFWAVANIIIKWLGPINGFTLNAWVAVLAVPQLMLASLALEGGQWQALRDADWRGWGAVAYTAVGASIIAYGLWYHLIGRYPVNRIVPLTLLSPVIAVLLAAVVLAEPLTLRTMIGGAVTLAGVAMIQFLQPGRFI